MSIYTCTYVPASNTFCSGVVYDENQKGVQFHITLWIVLTLIIAFLLGTYATFQISNTKDSLLYSKINTSSNAK
ncbi:conserved Plasmodium protein, unknown function [Plasmodium ovale]|uniref:Uncharacterized protein n=1 Tax=Plasmodium ovale TaxID=36330 RepID=A0A1D3TJJ1_PLAOA|nr:conserved Plasmodium protein, unknown function [Plasmodium ovale]